MLFLWIFFTLTLFKSVLLSVLLYNDLAFDPMVVYLLANCPISLVLLYWRHTHASEDYETMKNIVNGVFYVMRTISIFLTGILWNHHDYREANFAEMFLFITANDLLVAIAGGISTTTYKDIDDKYRERLKMD